jgi:putative membrane protein
MGGGIFCSLFRIIAMKITELITGYWVLNWPAIVIALLLIVFHLITNKKASGKKHFLFFTGVILMLLVTVSPLAFLGKSYLFSAHMIEHIVLLLIVPPFLLAGTSANLLEKLRHSGFRKIGEVLFSAPVTWLLGIGAMYFWHIPAVFDAMKKSSSLHIIHILSLLILGIIFIWPVYSPISWKRLSPLQSALYLFIACVGCTVLGILITFAPSDLYTHYLTGQNTEIWAMIRQNWGINPATDQEAGGLIMWVPACIIYITNVMLILARYYSQPYEDE